MRLAPILLFSTLLVISSHVIADAPSTPANVRLTVYSNTAAELFWDRSTDPENQGISAYEIRQDGVVIASVDALSYFTETLNEGDSTRFTITAIDRAGERSGDTSITATGGVRGEVTSDAPITPTSISVPTSVRIEVYSATAAEFFWARAENQSWGYIVTRNGEEIGYTDGNSFFDDSLVPGQSYQYTLTGLNAAGDRSSSAYLFRLDAPGSGTPPSDTPEPITPSETLPTVPTSVRIEVYSATAAEFFWDRPLNQSWGYVVTRNGEEIGYTDGNSFFDDSLAPGQSYQYTLIGVSAAGDRSSSEYLFRVETPGIGVSPIDTPVTSRDIRHAVTERHYLVGVFGFDRRAELDASVL